MATDKLPGMAPERVREELVRVLASSTFSSSERHRHFLSFVVEETLEGRAERIKAYTVATCVFGRSEDFDPQQDSIVRIEASRLRRQLEHYYLTEGTEDAVQIVIPKGTYVPQFVDSRELPELLPAGADDRFSPPRHRGPRVFVAPFEQEAAADSYPGFAGAFTRQIIMGLTRFGTVFVYGADTALDHKSSSALQASIARVELDYVLTGNIGIDGSQMTVDLLLQELPEGRYVWTQRLVREFAPAEIHRVRDETAAEIVQSLAQPYGILFSRSLDHEGEEPRRLGNYRAVVDYYRVIRSYELGNFDEVRRELEMAVEEDPYFAEAFACLSMLITDGSRLDATADRIRHVEEATSLARRAIALAPNSSNAHRALAQACWFGGDIDESLSAYRTALSLNPNDSGIMADLSLRYAKRMDWERAMPLWDEAFRRNACQAATFRVCPFLFHFAHGRHGEALKEARKMEASDLIYTQLARAAAAAETGRKDEASVAVAEIERICPGYSSRMIEDLRFCNFHPHLIAAITASLRKAGLRGLTTLPIEPVGECSGTFAKEAR